MRSSVDTRLFSRFAKTCVLLCILKNGHIGHAKPNSSNAHTHDGGCFFFILCVRAVIGGRMRRVCVSVCARAFERPRSKFN